MYVYDFVYNYIDTYYARFPEDIECRIGSRIVRVL